ncbi:MAG: alanine--glyoxylate aminotransferase family protein, partial [Planctomycetes bacterium]|nr:alanine--glyoxylate aminotransferase family protein [Planctomycetota bacterium]
MNDTVTDHPILFIPGPVEVDEELREIMAMPLVGHRSEEFKQCVLRVAEKLRPVFGTAEHAFFENAPGTALMEAGIRNLVRSRVLHLTCGSFGDRWVKTSKACGRDATVLEATWGTAFDPEAVRRALESAPEPFEAVCITHNETSTGVLNPLAEIARVVHEVSPDTMILVDAVTSLGGAELRFDDWGIDLAFAGTQKCLALPPGLCVFALSQRAIDKAATVEGRGFLFDFAATPERFEKGAPPATPCIPLAFALDRRLDRIAAEGIENRWKGHLEMQSMTLAWAEQH